MSKTKAPAKVYAARGLVTDPDIRRAALKAAGPMAQLSFGIGKRLARRRTRKQLRQIERRLYSLAGTLGTYGPQVAQQLGLIERPKAKRTAPLVVAGAVVGATATYLLEPGSGAQHRRQVQHLVGRLSS